MFKFITIPMLTARLNQLSLMFKKPDKPFTSKPGTIIVQSSEHHTDDNEEEKNLLALTSQEAFDLHVTNHDLVSWISTVGMMENIVGRYDLAQKDLKRMDNLLRCGKLSNEQVDVLQELLRKEKDNRIITTLGRRLALRDPELTKLFKDIAKRAQDVADGTLFEPCVHDNGWSRWGDGEFEYTCDQCGDDVNNLPLWYTEHKGRKP